MARIALVRDILERVWPRITEGDEESIVVRGVWRAAWETLQEHGILAARIIGRRCLECGGTGLVTIPEPHERPEGAEPCVGDCPVCHGRPVATLVEKAAWEETVCRFAELPLACRSKADAEERYRHSARRAQDFERWWSGLETRLLPIARALMGGPVLEADEVGILRSENGSELVMVTFSVDGLGQVAAGLVDLEGKVIATIAEGPGSIQILSAETEDDPEVHLEAAELTGFNVTEGDFEE